MFSLNLSPPTRLTPGLSCSLPSPVRLAIIPRAHKALGEGVELWSSASETSHIRALKDGETEMLRPKIQLALTSLVLTLAWGGGMFLSCST